MSATDHPLRRFIASTRTRILVAFFVLLALSSAATVVVLRQILLARVGDRVERTLNSEVRRFRALTQRPEDPVTGSPFGGDVRRIFDAFLVRHAPSQGEAFLTYVGGDAYRSSSNAGPRLQRGLAGVADSRRPVRGEIETDRGPARFIATPVSFGGRQRGVLAAVGFLDPERSDVTESVRIAAGVSIIVALTASLLVWIAAGRALAPLRMLSDTARSIGESDLTRRIPVKGHDEIAELSRTFNAMLDRLESAFGSQKDFLGDAGHELRTPITIIRGHLELLGDDPVERRETLALVADELDRMSRLVDDLLVLARAQRPDFLRREPLDLDVLTHEIYRRLDALGPRSWRLESAGVGPLTADRQRIIQAMVNLAQNAVQQTSAGAPIEFGSAMQNGSAFLWVRDHGPGIGAGEQDQIFDRFSHGADRHGVGLGLAIVKAIAEAHGGRVQLVSTPGVGALFTLVLPATPTGEEVT